jgi:hypothetical protein
MSEEDIPRRRERSPFADSMSCRPTSRQTTHEREPSGVDTISDAALERAMEAVVTVGDGRGFLVESSNMAFVAARPRLRVGGVPQRSCPGWLLALDGQSWERCVLDPGHATSAWLSIRDTERQAVAPGTSGSPVLTDDGRVLAVIATGSPQNPILANTLPLGLASEVLTQKEVVEIYRARRRFRRENQSQIRALLPAPFDGSPPRQP